MINPTLILAGLGANVISEMISALAYVFTGDYPHFFSNMTTAIGWFVLLNIFYKKSEEKEKKKN